VFAGVAAKSAQVPLHVWLPDAMEGPTPVSALIHAATMVAAGVYLLCRLAFLLVASPAAASLVSMLGALTALLAALIAVTQTDLKRVLAYSTISQLGYMVMAAGLGGTTPALFHLATHACFKALLFLCAGSVIIALHHHQDLREMGGLRTRLPLTFAAFLVGTLALAGVWPLSGFYSKDAILVLAWQHDAGLFACAAAAAVLTAFYMGRCLLLAFFGEPRSEIATHPHRDEGMHVAPPLIALSLAAIVSGWAGLLPGFLEGHVATPAVIVSAHPTLPAAAVEHVAHDVPAALHLLLPLLPLIGFIPAFLLFRTGGAGDAGLRRAGGSLYRLSERKFYFDEILSGIESVGQGAVAWFTAAIERGVFQRAVPFSASFLSGQARRAVSWTQSGNLRAYALVCALGSLVFVLILLIAEGT
jgi:NADH-quinone oxidoreductase subunit L